VLEHRAALTRVRVLLGCSVQAAAKVIKDAMDKKYGGPWHCICGEGFGFSVQCVRARFRLASWRAAPRALVAAHSPRAAGRYEGKHLCYVFHGGTGRRIAILLFKSCQI
jgi:hypothetical protein